MLGVDRIMQSERGHEWADGQGMDVFLPMVGTKHMEGPLARKAGLVSYSCSRSPRLGWAGLPTSLGALGVTGGGLESECREKLGRSRSGCCDQFNFPLRKDCI